MKTSFNCSNVFVRRVCEAPSESMTAASMLMSDAALLLDYSKQWINISI